MEFFGLESIGVVLHPSELLNTVAQDPRWLVDDRYRMASMEFRRGAISEAIRTLGRSTKG
jgi:hypothetical protein